MSDLFSPDDVRAILKSPEFMELPYEEREQIVNGGIREANEWVSQNEGWNSENFRGFTQFANETRAALKESKTLMDSAKDAGGVVLQVLKDSAASLGTLAGDLGVVNDDGSLKLPLENVGKALGTNVAKVGQSFNETLAAPLTDSDNLVELAVEALKLEIDEGLLPLDAEGLSGWLQERSDELVPLQAEWMNAEDWGMGQTDEHKLWAQENALVTPQNLGLLTAYVKTRDPEAMEELRKRLLRPMGREAVEDLEAKRESDSKYARFLNNAFGEGASRYISEAGDPFEIMGTVVPVLKGAKALERGASAGRRVGELAKGAATEVLSEQGSLWMDDPNASMETRMKVAKDAFIGSLGLMGAGAAAKGAYNLATGAKPVAVEDAAAEMGVAEPAEATLTVDDLVDPDESATPVVLDPEDGATPVVLDPEMEGQPIEFESPDVVMEDLLVPMQDEVMGLPEVVAPAALEGQPIELEVAVPSTLESESLVEGSPVPVMVEEVLNQNAITAVDPVMDVVLEPVARRGGVNLGPGASGVSEWGESRFGKRIKASDEVKGSWHASFEPGSYRRRSEAEWDLQSNQWIDTMGIESALEMAMDPESGIEGSDRVALAGTLLQRVDSLAYEAQEQGRTEDAAVYNDVASDLAGWLSLNGSMAGQEVRAYGLLVKQNPTFVLREFEKKRAEGLDQQMEQELGVTATELATEVEQATAEAVATEVAEVAAELDVIEAEGGLAPVAVEVEGKAGKGGKTVKPEKRKTRTIAERVEALIEKVRDAGKKPTVKRVDELMDLVRDYRAEVNDQFVPTLVGWAVPQERAQVLADVLNDERALKVQVADLKASEALQIEAQKFLDQLEGVGNAPGTKRAKSDFKRALEAFNQDPTFALADELVTLGVPAEKAARIQVGLEAKAAAKDLRAKLRKAQAQAELMLERMTNPKAAAKREVGEVTKLVEAWYEDASVDFLTEAKALGVEDATASAMLEAMKVERLVRENAAYAASAEQRDAAAQRAIDRIVNPVQRGPKAVSDFAKLKQDYLDDPSIDVTARARALGVSEVKAAELAKAFEVDRLRLEVEALAAGQDALDARAQAVIDRIVNPAPRGQKVVSDFTKLKQDYLNDPAMDVAAAAEGLGVSPAVAQDLAVALKVELDALNALAAVKDQRALERSAQAAIDRVMDPKVKSPVMLGAVAQLKKAYLADPSMDVVAAAQALGLPANLAVDLDAAFAMERQAMLADQQARAVARLNKQAAAMAKQYLNPQARAAAEMTELRKLGKAYLANPLFDFMSAAQALGLDSVHAAELQAGLDAERVRLEEKARQSALKRVLDRLNPKSRKGRSAMPKVINHMMDAVTSGHWNDGAYLEGFAKAFDLPVITPAVRDRLRDMARAAMKAPAGPLKVEAVVALQNELAVFSGIKAADALLGAWYANMLSGLSTQGMNVWGNASNLTLRSLAVVATNPMDAAAYLGGILKGWDVAKLKAAHAWKTGMMLKGADKYTQSSALELMTWDNSPGLARKAAYMLSLFGAGKYVFRGLSAMDAVFYFTALEGRAHLAASRAVRARGLKVGTRAWYDAIADDLGVGVSQMQGFLAQAEAELRQVRGANQYTQKDVRRLAWEHAERSRPNEIRAEAERFAAAITYTKEPEGMGYNVYKLINSIQSFQPLGVPVLIPFVPFAKILANVLEQNMDFTALGVLRGMRGSNVSTRAEHHSQAYHAMEGRERAMAGMMGMAAMGVTLAMAWSYKDMNDEDVPFMIYAMGPKNKATMPKGWKPYTIKIGRSYWSYAETPLAFALAPIGALMDDLRYTEKVDMLSTWQRFGYVMQATVGATMKMGVLSSVGNMFEVISGERDAGDMLGRTASSFVPAAGFIRDMTPLFDPAKISNDSMAAAFFRDIPVVRGKVGRPDLNIWGEPTQFAGLERLPVVKRIAVGQREDELNLWLVRNKLTLSALPKTVEVGDYLDKGEKRFHEVQQTEREMNRIQARLLTPDERYELARRSGQIAKVQVRELRELVEGQEYSEEFLQKRIDAIFSGARSAVMLELVEKLVK